MAATGFTPVYLYYSSTATNQPSAGNLGYGELAINITDGKLFYKDNANAVQVIGWKIVPVSAGGTGATSASITAFNNITGYTASGATGTTSTNLVFSTSPALTTPTITAPLVVTNTAGSSTIANYLQVVGATANNSNYPGIELKGGTLATTYPNIALGDGGLAININAGNSVSYPGVVNVNLDATVGFTVNTAASGTAVGALIVQLDRTVRPGVDNTSTLGSASYRWQVVYAGTGTINTSDETQKQQITDLTNAEKATAKKIKGLIKTFKFNDAVEKKGENARIHIGVIAQEVQSAFEQNGLDASRYGLFCSDICKDDDGNEFTRLGVRYEELLAFVIAGL